MSGRELRISASEVIVFSLPPEERAKFFNEEEQKRLWSQSREGRLFHNRLETETARLMHGNLFDPGSGTKSVVQNEVPVFVGISHVVVTGVIDTLINGRLCIEFKPTLRGRHITQLMIVCMLLALSAEVDPVGMLFSYRDKQNYILPDGGASRWDDAQKACVLAAEIRSGQGMIDAQKNTLYSVTRRSQRRIREWDYSMDWAADLVDPNQLVSKRKEFDEIMDNISRWR